MILFFTKILFIKKIEDRIWEIDFWIFGFSDILIFGTQIDKIIEIVIIFHELIKVKLSYAFYIFL